MTDAAAPPHAAALAVDSRTYAVDRAIEPVRFVFRWGSLVMLLAMVTLPFVQVVAREIFGMPIVGVEELARFMLICAVFLALPYVISAGASIRIDEIVGFLPRPVTRLFRIVAAATATAAFGTIAVASALTIGANLKNATPTLGLPYWIFFGAAFVSFAMSAVECAIQLAKALADRPLYVTFPAEQEPDDLVDLPTGH